MAGLRSLIVNADDFGRASGINRGVVRAHEEGIVTSASLMVRFEAAEEAAAYSRGRSELAVGLHVDLGEWRHQSETWVPVYEVVDLEDSAAVEKEVDRQLAEFRRLAGRDPTHLDSHQHVHRSEPVRSALRAVAERLAVPLRGETRAVLYSGEFYGRTGTGEPLPGALAAERLIEIIRSLPPGITELGCHPGAGDRTDPVYGSERELELAALCDPRVREAIEKAGIRLCSFADISR